MDITPRFLDANFRFLGGQAVDVWLANSELVTALGDRVRVHVACSSTSTQPVDGVASRSTSRRDGYSPSISKGER